MSRLLGGIFSRPSGQTSGIVFGASKSRRGKQVTSRQKVIPANPRTPAQVLQREKFSAVSNVLRQIDPQILQKDLNNKLGGLSGGNALSSRLLKAMPGSDTDLVQPQTLTLGSMHASAFVGTHGEPNEVSIEWNGLDLGFDGAAGDQVTGILVAKSAPAGVEEDRIVMTQYNGATRGDEGMFFAGTGIQLVAFWIGIYYRGVAGGDAPGKLSQLIWYEYDPA